MQRLLFSIFLIVLVYSQANLRLNTKQATKLSVDKSLTSTLGLFRATLRKTKCSLDVSYFNDTTYVLKGNYVSPNVTSDCSFLQVVEGALITSENQTFMYVGDSFNESTIFTIDDLGVMRLIGSYIKLNRVDMESFETNLTQFYTPQKFIYAGTQLNVKFTSTFGPLVNDNRWGYMAQFGQLDLYYDEDPNKTSSYVYSRFKFNNSQIQDFNSDTFPAAIFSNITFEPRCFEPRIYINFKAPYLIIADQFFPRVSVLEQGGYKVFEFVYAKKSEFTYQQDAKDIHYWRQFSLCPDETFEHKGQCLTKCPEPYFHEMRGRAGTCRLVCEEFTPIDTQNRICTCMSTYEAPKYNSEMIKSCPNDTEKYPYGCVCKTANKFFDKKISYSCVDTCPQTTFAHQGLCVNCPNNCITCGIDSFHRMFLECKVCQSGYKLDDGQCFKECNSNLGFSLAANGTCLKCNDSNCVNCSIDPNVCLKCNILYTLSNGSCLQSCPQNTTLVPASFFDSQCLPSENTVCKLFLAANYKSKPFLKCDECVDSNLIPHLNSCVSTCPTGYKQYENITTFVYCTCKQGRTVGNQCLNISGCPIKMYYDIYSDSCLSCSFGCITCRGSICTSCYPGYFLYVSPLGILCRRKSPLFACTDQYGLWNDVCLASDFQNLKMTQCIANIPNCRVCPYRPYKEEIQTSVCVLCELGFYLHENKCVKTCPAGTIIYANSVCTLIEIEKCAIPHLQSTRQASILNITLIQKNKAYGHYVFDNLEPANDPVGYIPYYQKLTAARRVTDGLFRENSFFEPDWICLKCEDGFGLAENGKKCMPCLEPCITCYLALNNSCLSKKPDPVNNNTDNNTKNNTTPLATSCLGYVEYSTKQCLKSCNSTNSYPELQNSILYCKTATESRVADVVRIDSAIYVQGDGTKVAYFVFENQIPQNTNVTVRIKKNVLSTNRLLAEQYTQKVVQIIDKRYFEVTTAIDENVIIANFTSTISKLGSVQGYFPPNLIYGSTAQNTHPEFMKTWLAIIGQIMGVVILVMHCVYVGNELLYKMDNLIILAQTVYYFSFVKVLIGRLLAQFYYGWTFAHVGFFPNFFTTPDMYRENAAPISYKLASTDANFIRNAGFSISVFLVFIGAWIIVTAVSYLLSKKLHKKEIWHPKIAKSSLIAGIEIFSMNIIYWAVAHFLYRGDCLNCDADYHKGSLAWAIIFTVLICVYSIGRLFFNPIGGLYMFKRVLIACILPAAFEDLKMMAPLLVLQLVFVILRFLIEKPELAKQKISILVEFGAFLLCYLLMFLCSNSGVNTIIISIVMFFYIVILMSDFMEVYLESRNEWEVEAIAQEDKDVVKLANQGRASSVREEPPIRTSQLGYQ